MQRRELDISRKKASRCQNILPLVSRKNFMYEERNTYCMPQQVDLRKQYHRKRNALSKSFQHQVDFCLRKILSMLAVYHQYTFKWWISMGFLPWKTSWLAGSLFIGAVLAFIMDTNPASITVQAPHARCLAN